MARAHPRHLTFASYVALACVVFSAAAAVIVPASAAHGAAPISEVDRLPSLMSNSTRFLAADTAARRLFEIGQPANGSGMSVAAYDLDSLRRVALFPIAGADSGNGGRLAAVDELRHRLFVVVPMRVSPADDSAVRTAMGNNRSVVDTTARLFFGIAVIDTIRLQVLGIRSIADVAPALPQDTSFSNNAGVKALEYDGATDKLYLETEDVTTRAGNLGGPADHIVFLHQLDANTLLSSSSSARDWSYPVPACAMALTGGGSVTSVLLITQNPPTVEIPCRHNPGEAGGVARVNVRRGANPTDTSQFSVDYFAMPGALPGLVVADPDTDRLFLRVDAATGETAVAGFDGRSGTWLGVTVTPTATWGLTVDPARKRLYMLSAPNHAGTPHVDVVFAASDAAPTDQGTVTRFTPHADPVLGRAINDPIRHRIIWSTFLDYMVIEDALPAVGGATRSQPDANTIDRAEAADTAANFFGGARAYGSRVRWVGGTRAVQQNVNNVVSNIAVPPVPKEVSTLLPAGPGDGTRDLHFARVEHATLSNGEASADGVGLEFDEQNTGGDIENGDALARRGGDQTSGVYQTARTTALPYQRAHCADFGGGAPTAAATGASASCALATSKVTAVADFEQDGAASIVITKSTSSVVSRRDPLQGVVSEAHAEARGIFIGDQISIGRVTSVATTIAHGRPGTAHAQYTRTIENVRVQRPDGTMQQVCTSPCDPQVVADAINRLPGGRVRVTFPSPDAARLRGSPGGYEGLVVRDFFEQIDNRVSNDEADVRLEVPAIEVTVVDDSRVRSRVVASLAATSAESHYGIYLLAADVAPIAPAGGAQRTAPVAGAPVVLGTTGTRLQPALPPTSNPFASIVRKVRDGIHFTVSSPSRAARSFAVWALLVSPLVLAARRRRFGLTRP